jgi:hypothetical protein
MSVVWTGRARCAALAVFCGQCNQPIRRECVVWMPGQERFAICDPHRARVDYAYAMGFRDVAALGPLFLGVAP